MRSSLSRYGWVVGGALALVLGVALWVGARIGAAVPDTPRAAPVTGSLLGERAFIAPPPRERHGAIGEVTAVDPPRLVLIGREGETRIILVSQETMLAPPGPPPQPGDPTPLPATPLGVAGLAAAPQIQPGTRLLIIGRPTDEGQLEARIIRILPVDADLDWYKPDRERKNMERKEKVGP